MKVISVNAGRVKPVGYGSIGRSGIDKRPMPGRAAVTATGLATDEHGDTRHHGGIDKALYAVAREELDWWSSQLGRPLHDGQFGENVTTLGVAVDDAVIGEQWRVGSALLEVSCPRLPCSTFQGFLGEQHWVKRFTDHGRPGAYLRVLEAGEIGAGDAVERVFRPEHGVTIAETFRALNGDRTLASRLLLAPELPAAAHQEARRLLALR
jgi:MOSC domain-containing protein YiiM